MRHASAFGSTAIAMILLLTPSLGAAQTVLRFGHIVDTAHPVHLGAVAAAEEMAACTGGAMTIEIFPGGQLGNESALNAAVQVGGVDLINTGTNFLSNDFPLIGVTTLPYMLRSRDHALAYVGSPVLRGLMDQWQEYSGQYMLAASYGAAFNVVSNTPYPTPAEIAGQRIRIPNAPSWAVFVEATGAVPTPIALAEVYLALQQGVVDGAVLPLPVVDSQKFHEVANYVNMTQHLFEVTFMIAGEHVRGQLDDAQWGCLEQAGAAYARVQGEANIAAENRLRADLTAADLIEFVDVDAGAYRAAVQTRVDAEIAARGYPADLVAAIGALAE